MLCQLSNQVNQEQVVMWVIDNPVDDGCITYGLLHVKSRISVLFTTFEYHFANKQVFERVSDMVLKTHLHITCLKKIEPPI